MVESNGAADLQTVHVRAKIRRSKNTDVYIVRISAPGLVEPATFYTSEDDVTPVPNGSEIDGTVRALLLKKTDDGKFVVLISGDAVSYGPQMVLPQSLVTA